MASHFRLSLNDGTIAREYLGFNEYEVSFDHIVIQPYECGITIHTKDIERVALLLSIPSEEYSVLKELIAKKPTL